MQHIVQKEPMLTHRPSFLILGSNVSVIDYQSAAPCPDCKLQTALEARLSEHILDMPLDRAYGHMQIFTDFLV